MELDYATKIRILHLLIAVFLGYGAVQYLREQEVPRMWYQALLVLAVVAAVYHGKKLYERYYPSE